MKRFLTLFVVLCLIFTVMAMASCGGGNDTDTNTDTNTDTSTDTNTDTDSDAVKEATYVITIKDQEGALISGARVAILNADSVVLAEQATDENGQVKFKLPEGTMYVDVVELPEGYLDIAGNVLLENEDTVIEVENNIPNGTISRPYPVVTSTRLPHVMLASLTSFTLIESPSFAPGVSLP